MNGNNFASYIIGVFQQEVEDDTYSGPGRFGHTMSAGTNDEPITVKFDNLAYWLLPEAGQVGPVLPRQLKFRRASQVTRSFPWETQIGRTTTINADNWTKLDVSCFKSETVDGKFVFSGKRNRTCWKVSHPRVEDIYL